MSAGEIEASYRLVHEFGDEHPPGGTDPFKPLRQHGDGLGDIISDATATTPKGESLTRQEFANDVDVNQILKRFGVDTPVRTGPIFTETDFSMDLQQSLMAIEQARKAHNAVPPELREKYPTWRDVLEAAERGEYQQDLKELATKKEGEKASSERAAARAQIERDQQIRQDIEAERAAAAVRSSPPDKTPKP